MAVILVAFVGLQCLLPLRTAIRIGPDEGYEAAKTTLCLKGYKLYSDIWNDQPPLHTFLLTSIVRCTERVFSPAVKHKSDAPVAHSLLGPRLLTVLAGMVLLASLFLLTLRMGNAWIARIGTALLLSSPAFLELSSSCMVEVVALAPAVVALSVLAYRTRRGVRFSEGALPTRPIGGSPVHRPQFPWPLLCSGVLFGVSLQIKFINAPLLIVAGLLIWTGGVHARFPAAGTSCGARRWGWAGELAKGLLILGASTAVTFVALNYLADGGSLLLQFRQCWAAHFAGTKSFEQGSPEDRAFEWFTLVKNWDLTLPALAGVGVCLVDVFRPPKSSPGVVKRGPAQRFAEVTQPKAEGQDHSVSRVQHAVAPSSLGLSLLIFGTHKPWWTSVA